MLLLFTVRLCSASQIFKNALSEACWGRGNAFLVINELGFPRVFCMILLLLLF